MRIISLHTLYKSNTHARSKEWIFTIGFLASSPSRIAKNIDVGRPESQPHVLQPAVVLCCQIIFCPGFCRNRGGSFLKQTVVECCGHSDRLRKYRCATCTRHSVQRFTPPIIFWY